MSRSDEHLDAMLRHLGAAYYESLHGRATRADVTRALDTVEDHLHEQAPHPAGTGDAGYAAHEHGGPQHGKPHPRGWARRVSDVMTASPVTVDRITPYKEIARLLAAHRVSGMPVLMMGRHVVGVVTEADLLAAQEKTSQQIHAGGRPAWWPHRQRHAALTAGELMTAPAIVIGPAATLPAAARLMGTHHVRRLPVVDDDGRLIGIVSRRDLLSVFLRPDDAIAADVREVLDEFLLADAGNAEATVRNGVVTLTGTLRPAAAEPGELIPLAVRLMWDVDGVVDVVNHLGEAEAAPSAQHPG